MKRSRLLPLLGPAGVLYLVSEVASSGRGLDARGWAMAAVGVLLSFAPLLARRDAETAGAGRVAFLGVAAALAVFDFVDPSARSLAVDLAAVWGLCVSGALAVDLALTVPDRPRAFERRALRLAPWGLGGAAALLGVLAVAPAFELIGRTWIFPTFFAAAPRAWLFLALVVATAARLARRRLGAVPDALAANAWAALGLVPATLAVAVGLVAVVALGAPMSSAWARGPSALAALLAVGGHLWMIDPRRRLSAGGSARRAVTSAATMLVVGVAVAGLRAWVPRDPSTLALYVMATLLLAAAVYRALRPSVRRVLAPFGGRLLTAVEEAERDLAGAAALPDVARAVLGPLRRASGSVDAAPYLYSLTPAREARIDLAGEPHVDAREMPPPVAERLADRPGEIIVRAALESIVVRRPELRPLVECLVSRDALCVVPVSAAGDLEGALVVPRGRRRMAPTLEELDALEKLARRLGSYLALLSAQERARQRAEDATRATDRLEERIEALDEELGRLRTDTRVLKAGSAADRLNAPPIAYAPSMRALLVRTAEVGPLDAPVLLVAEGGTPTDTIGHLVHEASGRASGPFVVANCAVVRPDRSAAALFGEDGGDGPHPGWLRLAAGGSVLLVDVPALTREAQRELAEALAVRQARPVGGAGAYPLDVRVIATSRLPLQLLAEAGAFDADLAQWLTPLTLRVPPLRERRDDLPSLVLLALDRACRVLGREIVGIDAAALDALRAREWHGNLRELDSVIEQAVARTQGTKVVVEDLPPAPGVAAYEAADPLMGTYEQLERRILARALERAAGNKSEAARLLGLKRSTFLDKLRRFGLEDKAATSEDAA